MKSLWTVVTVLAIANLLAIIGFVGWLNATGRVSRERVDAVRGIFVSTVEQEKAALAEVEAQREAEAIEEAKAARLAQPPIGSAERLRQRREGEEVALHTKQRLEDELLALQTFLVRENERLLAWEKELASRQAAMEAEQLRIRETTGSDQFKKALATLSGVKPAEAKSILAELLAQEKQDEVVSYLDAIEERARSRILAEFNKTDPRLAADLLERLRTRGIAGAMTAVPGEPSQ